LGFDVFAHFCRRRRRVSKRSIQCYRNHRYCGSGITEHEFEDAQSLWKFFYAQECFRKAKITAAHILESGLDSHHEIYYPLLVAVYVLYGKPFKFSRPVGKISEEIVPENFRELHKQLIQHRDQLYAHTDANGFEIADRGSVNQVRFLVTPEGKVHLFAPLFHARPPLLPGVRDLCDVLQEKCRYHVNKLQLRHQKQIPPPPGEYIITVLDKERPFVNRSSPLLGYL
jgi:hypothetical protein